MPIYSMHSQTFTWLGMFDEKYLPSYLLCKGFLVRKILFIDFSKKFF